MPGSRQAGTVVIGGGLHGLAAAWNLSRIGSGPVVLLEQFQLGHDRGSSHGATRMCRSTYSSRAYVHLLQAALEEDWPRLEREAGRSLIRKNPACFFGPPEGMFASYARTMKEFDKEVEYLTPSEASRIYPQIRFDGMEGALRDNTAGVIAAGATISTLIRACRNGGVEIHENTRALGIHSHPENVTVETDGRNVAADRVIVTAGPWTSSLLPVLDPELKVVRQNIGYFSLPQEPELRAAYPPWVYLGMEENDFYYGLPELEGGTMKVARHVTLADSETPDSDRAANPNALQDLELFVSRHLKAGTGDLLDRETCLYTNTPDEDFVIDVHPKDSRIVFGAGFSGHGFKFGPLTGRILAELSLFGKSQVPAFNRHRTRFSVGP